MDYSSYNPKKSVFFDIQFTFDKKNLRIRECGREETNESLRKLQKDGAPDDSVKHAEDQVQKLTDQYSAKLDELLVKKEADIMKF